MKDYVYMLYNVLNKRYEGVMSFSSDGMAIHRLTGKVDKNEFELCRVGSFDIESGTMETYSPVRLIWDEDVELPKTEAK